MVFLLGAGGWRTGQSSIPQKPLIMLLIMQELLLMHCWPCAAGHAGPACHECVLRGWQELAGQWVWGSVCGDLQWGPTVRSCCF